MFCFNCKRIGYHTSQNCEEPQTHTRCASCLKVTFNQGAHTNGCANSFFVSTPVSTTTTVFDVKEHLKIDFKYVSADISICDVHREVKINSGAKWLSTIDAFVSKVKDRSLIFTGRPMNRNVTIIDKHGKAVVSLAFHTKVLIVNGRYEINEKGQVTFNCNSENQIQQPVVCKIKVENDARMFKLRVSWWGNQYIFEVYPDGATLIDPQLKTFQVQAVDDAAVAAGDPFVNNEQPLNEIQRVDSNGNIKVQVNIDGRLLWFECQRSWIENVFSAAVRPEERKEEKRLN